MAHEYADGDPHASEYAGKGSPNDSDNDEGLYVEPNANITTLLTTRGSRNSSTMDKLEHLLHTLRVWKEEETLPEESNRFESLVERALNIVALTSDDAENPVTQEVHETHLADGSSSDRPLEVGDGNHETSMPTNRDTRYGPTRYVDKHTST